MSDATEPVGKTAAAEDADQVEVVVDAGTVEAETATELEPAGSDEPVVAAKESAEDIPTTADSKQAASHADDTEEKPAATAADLAALSTDELKKLTYESCENDACFEPTSASPTLLSTQTRRATLNFQNWCIWKNQSESILKIMEGPSVHERV